VAHEITEIATSDTTEDEASGADMAAAQKETKLVETSPAQGDALSQASADLRAQVASAELSDERRTRIEGMMAQLATLEAMRQSGAHLPEIMDDRVPAIQANSHQLQAIQDLQASIDADPLPDPHKLAALKDMRDSLRTKSVLTKQALVPAKITNTIGPQGSIIDKPDKELPAGLTGLLSQLEQSRSEASDLEQLQNELLHMRAQIVAQSAMGDT